MARPPRFTDDDVLDAAARAVHEHGRDATVNQVAQALGGPTGSIYHRFASREHLMTSLWLRAVRRFHAGLLDAYAAPDPHEALLASARHIPRYCRENPVEANALTLYRQPDLAGTAPEALREAVRTINDPVVEAATALVRRRFGSVSEHHVRVVLLATQACPYGLVRPHVGREVPDWLEDACVAAAGGILALGDA